MLTDDLSDMAWHNGEEDPFHQFWKVKSRMNSDVYHWLDGEDMSIYSCRNLHQLRNGIKDYNHKSSLKLGVIHQMNSIQGYLIDWPINFLQDEDLSRTATFQTLSISNLWL